MADKYISVKAAVTALLGDETVHIPSLLFAQKRIEAIPAADVVEVVRCGECKNVFRSEAPALWCVGRGWPMQMVPLDGFCDKGKREEITP